MNQFKVGFKGSSYYKIVSAPRMKEAKEIFAKEEKVFVSSYIYASKAFTCLDLFHNHLNKGE